MSRRYKILLVWFVVIVLADQLSKHWATTYLYAPQTACGDRQLVCLEGCQKQEQKERCERSCAVKLESCYEKARASVKQWKQRLEQLKQSGWCRQVRTTTEIGPPECVVISGWLSFRYARNPGTAWGVFGSLPTSWRRALFVVVTMLALGFLGFLLLRSNEQDTWQIHGLSVLCGGAVGNFLDRLRMNHVIDFLDVYMRTSSGTSHWPTFNLADIAISSGVVLLALHVMFSAPEEEASSAEKA